MSFDLSTLRFQVETKQLDDAITKVGQLATSVASLNKPLSKLGTESKATATDVDGTTKAVAANTNAVKNNQTVLERQENILKFMADGFSKGQSSILAMGKASGLADLEMKKLGDTIERQRKLQGSEPFDKSIGAIKVLKNELGALREAYRQTIKVSQDSESGSSFAELSTKQSKDLYREKFRLIEQFKDQSNTELTTYSQLKAQLRSLNTDYLAVAKSRNALAGINTVQQTKRRDEIQYLARATSVQLGDIGVSLAGGQNPLTVLIQQADQMRGIFAQVGANAEEMKTGLSSAFKQIVVGFKDVVLVLGQFVAGAITDTAKAMVDFGLRVTGVTPILETLRKALVGTVGESSVLVRGFDAVGKVASTLVVGAFLGAIAVATTLALVFKTIIQTSQDLSVALAMSGGALNINKNKALEMVAALASSSGTSMQVASAITEIAKAGNLGRDSVAGITKAALDLEKYGGVAVKDTVAQYSKLADDPVKALTELALKTGNVSVATLDHIDSLVKQGESTEAVTAAITEMNRVNGIAAQTMYDDMSPLEKLWVDMKSQLTEMKEEIFAVARSTTVVNGLSTAWQTVVVVVSEVWFVLKGIVNEVKGIAGQMAALAKMDFKGFSAMGDAMKVSAAEARKAQDEFTKSVVEGTSGKRPTSSNSAVIAAEKQYINVMQAGVVVRKELYGQDAENQRKSVLNYVALEKEKEKYLTVSNMSSASREKKKLQEQSKIERLYAERAKTAGTDLVALEKEKQTVLAAVAEQYKPKKEAKAKKPQDVKDMEAAIKFMDDSLERSSGKLPTYTEDIKKLELAFKSGKYGIVEFMMAKDAYEARQPAAIAKVREETEALKKYNAETEKEFENILAVNKARLSLNKESVKNFDEGTYKNEVQAKELAFREEMIGKTDEQKNLAKIAFEQEAELIEINRRKTSTLIAEREKYNELLSKSVGDSSRTDVLKNDLAQAEARINSVAKGEVDNAAKKAQLTLKELNDAKLDKFSEGIADALITGMTEGAKAGKKKLRDLIVAELTKTITLNIQANIKSLLSGGGSGGGLLDMLMGKGSDGLLSKGLDLLGGLFGGGGAATIGGAASTFGAVTGTVGTAGMSASAGTGAAALAELSTGVATLGASAATGAASVTGMGSAILGAIPGIGWLALGATALFSIFGFGKDKIPTVLNDLALFNNSLIGLPFLELAIGSDEAAQGLRDVLYGLDNASPTMKKLAGETISLSIELLRATGDIAGAANLARNLGTRGMSEAEIAVYDYNQGLKDQIEAARAGASSAQAAAQAEEQLAKTRWDLAGKLNILLGRTTQKEFDRATQLAATSDAASIEMLNLIFKMEDLTAAVDAQYATLERSIAAERKLAETRLASATALQGVLKTAKDATTTLMTRGNAQLGLTRLLAIAKATGVLPSADAMKPLLDALVAPSEDLFGTFEDYQRDFLKTAYDIKEMSNLADDQVSLEQQAIDKLDAQLEAAKAQLDALKGVDNSVKDVATAIKDFDAAMRALGNAKSSAGSYNYSAPVAGGSGGSGGGGSGGSAGSAAKTTFEDIAGQENKDIVAAYREYYNRNPDELGYKNFIDSKLTGDKLMQAILGASAIAPDGVDFKMAVSKGYNPLDPMAKFLKTKSASGGGNVGVDGSFAQGINYVPNDMVAQIHQGERILPAADNAELFARLQNPQDNAVVMANAITRLTDEVKMLRAEQRQTVINTGKTAESLKYTTNENGTAFNVVIET